MKDLGIPKLRSLLRGLTSDDAAHRLGRVGWLGKGAFYVLLGTLVIQVGLGVSTNEASQAGALEAVARQPGGRLLLVALALSLVLYVFWRFATVLLQRGSDADAYAHRIGYGLSAAVYSVIAMTSLQMAWSGRRELPRSTLSSVADTLLGTREGRWVVGAVGVLAVLTGLYFGLKGVRRRYLESLDTFGWSRRVRGLLVTIGTIGWLGRAGLAILVGGFLVHAAFAVGETGPTDLDVMLARVASGDWGASIVVGLGAMLVSYGGFVLFTWRRRKLVTR